MPDILADLGLPKPKKKRKQDQAAATPSPPSAAASPGLLGLPAPATPRVPTGPQHGVEGYMPQPGRTASLPAEVIAQFEAVAHGPLDRSLSNLIAAHYQVFGTWPDYSLTSDLLASGEVEFTTPEEAVGFFQAVKKSYTGKRDWQLDAAPGAFGEGQMKRAAGVEGFTNETDILDPEMIASFAPKRVEDFLYGPYLKHTIEGESRMFRPNRMRLDELLVAVPKQWAISQLAEPLTVRGRGKNPDLAEDEALMMQLNSYLASRVPADFAPAPTAAWQQRTEDALRMLQMERAASIYLAKGGEDEEAVAFLAANGHRNLMTELDQQIRLPADPTGKADEAKRAWITEWYVNSRAPHQTERQAVHELYDMSPDSVTIQGQQQVGSDHMSSYMGVLRAVKGGLSYVAGDVLELDSITESEAFRDLHKAISPLAGAMGDVLGYALAPVKLIERVYAPYNKYTSAVFSATLMDDEGIIPTAIQAALPILGGNPIDSVAEFVTALHGGSDGDVSWFGNWLDQYKESLARYEEDPQLGGMGYAFLQEWGVSPYAHPELLFLANFGLETARDLLLWKGLKAGQWAVHDTSLYRNFTSLGKTRFVNSTVGGLAEKWINEDPHTAIVKLQQIFGLEANQAKELVYGLKGATVGKSTSLKAGKPVSLEAVRGALDESVRSGGQHLDPYSWNLTARLKDSWQFSHGKWYSSDRAPHLQVFTGRVHRKDGIALTGDRQEGAFEFIDYLHRHVLNLAGKHAPQGLELDELEIIKSRVVARAEGMIKTLKGSDTSFYKLLRDEVRGIESMTDLGLWRSSLYSRAEELVKLRERARVPKERLIDGDLDPALYSEDALKRLAVSYRYEVLKDIENDVIDMMHHLPASERWLERVGTKTKNLAEAEAFKEIREGKAFYPLQYEYNHWTLSQIRKAVREGKKEEEAPRFIPAQGTFDKVELSKSYNTATVEAEIKATEEELKHLVELTQELGLPHPELLRSIYNERVLAANRLARANAKREAVYQQARTEMRAARKAGEAAKAELDARIRAYDDEVARLQAEYAAEEGARDAAYAETVQAGEAAQAAKDGEDLAHEVGARAAAELRDIDRPAVEIRRTHDELAREFHLAETEQDLQEAEISLRGLADALEPIAERSGFGAWKHGPEGETAEEFLRRVREEVSDRLLSLSHEELRSDAGRDELRNLMTFADELDRRFAEANRLRLTKAEIEARIEMQLREQELLLAGYEQEAVNIHERLTIRFGARAEAGEVMLGEGEFADLLPDPETIAKIAERLRVGQYSPARAQRDVRDWFARQLSANPKLEAQVNELARRAARGDVLHLVVPEALDFAPELGMEGTIVDALYQVVNKVVRERAYVRPTEAMTTTSMAEYLTSYAKQAVDEALAGDHAPIYTNLSLTQIDDEIAGMEKVMAKGAEEFPGVEFGRAVDYPRLEAKLKGGQSEGIKEGYYHATARRLAFYRELRLRRRAGVPSPPEPASEAAMRSFFHENYPDGAWVPWTPEMREAERRLNELEDEVLAWQERQGPEGMAEIERKIAAGEEIDDEELAGFYVAMEEAGDEFYAAREAWLRGNPNALPMQIAYREELLKGLRDRLAHEEDPLERLEIEKRIEDMEVELEQTRRVASQIDDIFEEAGFGPEQGYGRTPEPRRTAEEESAYEAARARMEAAAELALEQRYAYAAAVNQARAARQNLRIHQQRLENINAKLAHGTTYEGSLDPAYAEKIREQTKWLDPSTPVDERVESLYTQIRYAQELVERLQSDPENWLDWTYINEMGKTISQGVEPQPALEWQLKQWFYPTYNNGKLAKFLYGGPVRAAEYLNSKKWFGYASADDATSLYKALIMAKISTLIRIPMADEMTRFITEGVNPRNAQAAARWMREVDKMPDDVKAEIASLLERISGSDSTFLHWGDPRFNDIFHKFTMDTRRDRTYAYWLAGRLKGPAGMQAEVEAFLRDEANHGSSLYRYVADAYATSGRLGEVTLASGVRAEVEEGLRTAYLLVGMRRGKPLFNTAFESHRLTRQGEATKQVLDLARLWEMTFSYFYEHPAFGHFWKLKDEALEADPAVIEALSRGSFAYRSQGRQADLSLGRQVTGRNGKTLDGNLNRRAIAHAMDYNADLIKGNVDSETTKHLMPWIVGRDQGIDVGGIPVVKNIQRMTYSLLDRIGSTMNEYMYATAFAREKEALTAAFKKTGQKVSEERIEELAHYHSRKYVFNTMFNGSTYFGEDMLRNVFMFLPAYRQFVEYWLPQAVKKPLTVGSFVYRANTEETTEGKSGFDWVRPSFFPDLQFDLSSISFLVNQSNNGAWGWLPGGGPIITMPVALMATINADDKTSVWGELPRHWPLSYAQPFRALNSPLDKMFYGLTGSRLPWPLGSDPDRDPWRELMATRTDALEGKWPNDAGNWRGRLHAMVEGGWNYFVPYQMRFSDRDVERMVLARKAYSASRTPEEMEKILSAPGNEVFKQFVEWQNLPSYLQLDYLQKHPQIIPFMVSGYDTGDHGNASHTAISWAALRTYTGVADPQAYKERLGYRYTQLKSISDALAAREERDREIKWWNRYRAAHADDHNIYRLTNEWEKSEGAFAPGGFLYQQGWRGHAFYAEDINLKFAGVDDSFVGISSYDADSFRLASLMEDAGGAAKAVLQLSPNYEQYILRKVEKSRDTVREIAKGFLDTREPTELTPSQMRAAGYSGPEIVKLTEAVNFIDRLWDEANRRIKPLGKYGYATSEGRAIRKRAIIAQQRLLHSNPLFERFLGEGAVSLFRSTYLTKPAWERSDFINLETMDEVERETFYRLLTRKDPQTGQALLKGVPYLPDGGVQKKSLPSGKVLGYQPRLRNGKIVGWQTKVKIGRTVGLIDGKTPRGVERLQLTIDQALSLMQTQFESTPSDASALLAWRKQVRAGMPRWAQDLAYDWVRAEAWKHYFDAASSARSHMRDTVNPWYSDTPGFSSQSKYGMRLKKWLKEYAGYLAKLSPEFGTEYRSYNDDNMLTNAILSWYL